MRLLLTIATAAWATGAFAQASDSPWFSIGGSDDGMKLMIRLNDVGQGSRDVWFKMDRSRQKTSPFRTSMLMYRIDCSGQRIGLVQEADYRPDGRTENFGPNNYPSMQSAVPESLGEIMLKAACPKE